MRLWYLYGILLYTFSLSGWADVSDAREALSKSDEDATQEKSLEEVLEATQNSYSLMKKGQTSMSYSMSYSYTADQRLNIEFSGSTIRAFDVTPSATHNLTNNFSFDFGYLNNLTLGLSVPVVSKYDTADSLSGAGLGDVSINARWQPYIYVPGELSRTVTGSFKTKTGGSPFRTIAGKNLPTGSGYYSLSGGMSINKVIDPVMLFGSSSLSYAIPEVDVNQIRSGQLLEEVHPGVSIAMSGGFAYSLSYDVSLSISFQGSYSDKSKYIFRNDGIAETASTMSGVMNFGLGIRVSPKTITNVGVGFGLTEDSPDIMLSVSMPISLNGLKAKFEPTSS
jgi:hypothetical protein